MLNAMMEQGMDPLQELPPILSCVRESTPSYSSLQGRGSDAPLVLPVDIKRKRPRLLSEPNIQELAPHKRSRAVRRFKRGHDEDLSKRGQREAHHKSSASGAPPPPRKSVSLPQLPRVPRPFNDFFAEAKHAVAQKRMEARWSPKAVLERVEGMRQDQLMRQQEMILRAKRRSHVQLAPLVGLPQGQNNPLDSAFEAVPYAAEVCLSPISASSGSPKASISSSPKASAQQAKSIITSLPKGSNNLKPARTSTDESVRDVSRTDAPPKDAELKEVDEAQSSHVLKERFDRVWYEVGDASGFEQEEALHMFSLFNRMLNEGDNELDKDELPEVVGFLGFLLHDESGISRIANEITFCSTLSFEEYLRFLRKYTELEQETWKHTFSKYDVDSSGSISVEELKCVMKDLGYTPTQNMLQEALAAVDSDSSGQVDYEEFKTLMSRWRALEGLTEAEFAELKELFGKFDSNSDGELHPEELARLKKYLGMTSSPPGQSARARQMPTNWRRFLLEVRYYREHEIGSFRKLFNEQDKDGSGELDVKELLKIFEGCGFQPLMGRLSECIAEVDADGSGSLNFEEFVQIMWLYRRTEGFTGQELTEMDLVFTKFDKDDSGEISTLELGDLLRYEGYSPNFKQVQVLCDEYDVDGSGDIGLREYRKVMRNFREAEVRRYRDLFVMYDRDGSDSISTQEVAGMLREYGHEVSLPIVLEAIASVDADGSGDLNWDEFVELMEIYRKLAVRESRKCCGFSKAQVSDFKDSFDGYDKDHSNDLDNNELMKLLDDLNMAPRTEIEQINMLSMLDTCRELAGEKEGKTTFWVVLVLLRTLEDDQDRGSVNVERKAAEAARLSKDEVREFREIFNHWHAKLKELGQECGAAPTGTALTTEGIARILRSFGLALPKTSDYDMLEQMCKECDFDGNGHVDFPDFLVLMRRLLDDNFRDINKYIARPWQ